MSTLVEDLDAQTTLAKAIQEGRLDEVEKVGWDRLGWTGHVRGVSYNLLFQHDLGYLYRYRYRYSGPFV